MHILPRIDLYDSYEKEINSSKVECNYLENLILDFEKEKNIISFKEQFFGITQLYHDGLISKQIEENLNQSLVWKSQEETLNQLIKAGKISIGQFYRGEGINMNQVREIILPYKENILKFGETKIKSKIRHLFGLEKEIQTFGFKLQQELYRETIRPTGLMCIANGGFEPAYLAMNLADINDLAIVRYSHFSKEDSKLMLPKLSQKNYLRNRIENQEEVLIVDDWCCSGKTAEKVIKSVGKLKPKKIFFTSIRGNTNGGIIDTKIKIQKFFSPFEPMIIEVQ